MIFSYPAFSYLQSLFAFLLGFYCFFCILCAHSVTVFISSLYLSSLVNLRYFPLIFLVRICTFLYFIAYVSYIIYLICSFVGTTFGPSRELFAAFAFNLNIWSFCSLPSEYIQMCQSWLLRGLRCGSVAASFLESGFDSRTKHGMSSLNML